ncbi:MAG: AbrB/MazE/SpoVT family DNA-binding domain-containing protein [Anaerolineales bacterium]|nr:AbrB/MazE/SpoVT family DNA-binding domain-containing protein [Anaerolineales bacterium]
MTTFSTKIVKIGNSQGIRIPKVLLEQTKLGEDVEMIAEDGKLIIRPASNLRQDWDNVFACMAAQGDDTLFDHDMTEHIWDEESWEW